MSAPTATVPSAPDVPSATRPRRFPRVRSVLRNAGELYARLATNHPMK